MKKNQTVIAPDRRPSPHRTICLLLAVLLLLRLMPMPASAKASAVEVDGEADRFGTYQGYSTYSSGETSTDSFYYRDDWFQAEPSQANPALALLSMQLTAAAVDGTEDGFGAALLQKLGCNMVQFGLMFTLCTIIGGLTPPVGSYLFVTVTVVKTGVTKLIPWMMIMILVDLVVVALTTFIPGFCTWLPDLILGPM